MKKVKCDYVVMEVSSHALAQSRTDFIEFDVAIFTNLTLDHLDYHKSKREYFKAKAKLFKQLYIVREKSQKRYAVINIDDRSGRKLAKRCSFVSVISYGVKNKNADVRATNIKLSLEGTSFLVSSPGGEANVRFKLLGICNVYNALAAIAFGLSQSLKLNQIIAGIEAVRGIRGRFELIEWAGPFKVIIDYAHTPDALKSFLMTVRDMYPGRIITVFGCGGNRDKSKRPLMGKIARKYSDYIILTSDNPRQEDPLAIIKDIKKGVVGWGLRRSKKYFIEPDRQKAIEQAVSLARKDDLVIIAGKGHEDYQILKDTVVPFNDKRVVEEILKKLSI
jgi:UDP-N-acetylmuramoyl-L-alanyl-D-glutamate--2,6-diaminopimelate ligase